MSVTPWVPTVKLIQDGQDVSQQVVNVPLEQLIQRDQHLYDEFNELQNKSALTSFNQPIYPGDLTGANPITVGQLAVVYFRSDEGGEGISKASTGFSTDHTTSMFQPNASNYVFGIIRDVNPGNVADCYIQGMCEFSVPIDDPYNGLIEYSLDNYGNRVVQPFSVGPYYLSRKLPGKITQNPDGIPVYVGYALSPTEFILQPSVDEFTQFFINYRYNILDRPVYPPVLDSGSHTWTIPTPYGSPNNPDRLGWIAATAQNLPGYVIPTNPAGQVAKFFYYIPSDLSSGPDSTVLNSYEIAEANQLGANLPPVPSNFVQILQNGVTQRYSDVYAPDGIYSIDDYGIWWYSNVDGTQPWASDILTTYAPVTLTLSAAASATGATALHVSSVSGISQESLLTASFLNTGTYISNVFSTTGASGPTGPYTLILNKPTIHPAATGATFTANAGWDPTQWETFKGTNRNRARLFINFAKFNPALRTQLVSSLKPYNITTNPPTGVAPNNSSNFISFDLKSDPGELSATGDLLVNITPQFNTVGYSDLPKIVSATWVSGTLGAITFSSPHGLTTGQQVVTTGFYDSNNSWNGTFTVTVIDTSNISISGPTAAPITVGTISIAGDSTNVPSTTGTGGTYTAGSAVADLSWDAISGKFKKTVTPVVASLQGSGGINVTPVSGSPGTYNIAYMSQGIYGLVDSIEPVNSRLEFRGLNSYIKLPYYNPVTVPYGLIGKIVLTKDSFNNVPLNLILQVFGNSTYGSNTNNTAVALNFEYSATSAQNGAASSVTLNLNNSVSLTSAASSLVTLSLPSAGYTAYTPINISGGLVIPENYVGEDTVINFKITRNLTGSNNDYVGDIGILGIYWGTTSN